MLGFFLAIATILSRSSAVSERLVLLRKPSTNRTSSAARAASAGVVVMLRGALDAGFNAFMIWSAERSSAARAGAIAANKARLAAKITWAKPAICLSEIAGIGPLP